MDRYSQENVTNVNFGNIKYQIGNYETVTTAASSLVDGGANGGLVSSNMRRIEDVVPLQPTNGSHWSGTSVKID